MVRYKLLILLGCIFSVLISYVTAISLHDLEEDKPIYFIVTILAFLANYFCCIGFLDEDEKMFKNGFASVSN